MALLFTSAGWCWAAEWISQSLWSCCHSLGQQNIQRCLVTELHFIILLLHHLILHLSNAATFDSVCSKCYPLKKPWLDKNLYSNPVFFLFSCYASKWVEFYSPTGTI